MLVLRGFSAGDACFCQLLLMMLASGVDAGSAGGFCWGCLLLQVVADDACVCQLLQMMLALGFDAGSAEVFC